jgi:hypothetical protein
MGKHVGRASNFGKSRGRRSEERVPREPIPGFDQEFEEVIEKIAARARPEDLLSRIFEKLSRRLREILWGYLSETDAQKLGSEMGLEEQSIHNSLAIIDQKLGFYSRAELSRSVFSALVARLKKY